MKFYIFLTIVLFTFSSADKLNPEETNILKLAKSDFKNNNFENSYKLFKKLFLTNLTNVEINYYLAKSAIKIKKFGMASAAYERILINEPNNLEIKFEQAKLLYLTGNIEASIISLNKLLSKKLSNDLKKSIERYLNIITQNKKLVSINTTLLFSVNYMDNANSAPDEYYILPNFNYLGKQGNDKISDINHLEYINIDITKKLKNKEYIGVKNNFTYFKRTFLNEKDENIEAYSYTPAIIIEDDLKKYYLGTIFQRYQSGHEITKEYFDNIGLETKFYNKNYVIALKAQRFFYKDKNKNDKNYSSYQMKFRTFNRYGFNFSSRFEKDIAFKSNRTDLDKILFDNSISYAFKLDEKMIIEPSFRYKMTNYEYESIAFNSRRKDSLSELGLEFRKYIDNSSFISFKTSYLNNESNHEEYNYTNKSVGLLYVKKFSW